MMATKEELLALFRETATYYFDHCVSDWDAWDIAQLAGDFCEYVSLNEFVGWPLIKDDLPLVALIQRLSKTADEIPNLGWSEPDGV